jgi:PAS domain S-box-containing protein
MINPAGAAFFGRPVEEVLGRTVDDFLLPEDAAAVKEADKRTFATGKPLSIELNYTLSGVTRTFLIIKGIYRQKGKVKGLFGISRDITERKRAEAEILNCQQELRFLASEMSRKEEQERHIIASELHDKIGQTLALAKIRLELLDGGDESKMEAKRISELLDSAIRHTRSLTLELSPPILYELGFEAAVESLCEEFQSQYGIEVNFRDDRATKPLSDELRALLYRGVRELLVNIVKHARASRASVAIEKVGAFIRITVEDNGIGFDHSKSRRISRSNGGFGLFSIRERLAYLGGKLNIESTLDTGTKITLVAPLQVDPAAPTARVLRFQDGSRCHS